MAFNRDKYSKQITMSCPKCASTKFKFDPDVDESIRVYKCITCEREFTKDEIIQENAETINKNLSDLKKDVVKDVSKEIKKTLKDAFRDSKDIKIKSYAYLRSFGYDNGMHFED